VIVPQRSATVPVGFACVPAANFAGTAVQTSYASSCGPVPRRQERASLPVRGCPASELRALRAEAERLCQSAQGAARQKEELPHLVAELRRVLNENRTMNDRLEERKRLLAQAADLQTQAARKSTLDSARDLFKSMLAVPANDVNSFGKGSENVPPEALFSSVKYALRQS